MLRSTVGRGDTLEREILPEIVKLIGPERAVEFLGIRLVGVSVENGLKFALTLAFIAIVLLIAAGSRRLARRTIGGRDRGVAFAFWARQAIGLATAIVLAVGVMSIWFDDPTRLATALGLVSAGLAFALQKLISSVAGYFVILRGKTFNVGDRIRMGGVRGDVIALRFTQTTIMEMGQPPPVQTDDPAMWIKSRQYTGRIVTVSNAVIFDEPVYNYTREFPYVWEELTLPIAYDADHRRVERILLDAARVRTVSIESMSEAALEEMQRRYFTRASDLAPRVYYRLTDNWIELTVRFVAEDHGIRELKDAMSRDIVDALDAAGIGVATATFAVVGLPPLRLAAPAGRGAASGAVR